MTKYIVVTGGLISGVGKGIIASSTGLLLKTLGLSVTAIKIDPYLNIDAGTLSPLDHGEVFVLDDGGEVDLDLGNYERYLGITLSRSNNITTGKIYKEVIEKERRGDYLGKTVQVVPHITNAVQDWIEKEGQRPTDDSGIVPDICIIELGGVVGDIESAPFIEALRQFQFRVGPENFCVIHVTLVPVVGAVGEQKTKPTQMSIRELRGLGLFPDILACRSTGPLEEDIVKKLSMFCQVGEPNIFSVHDCDSLYHVPLLLRKQGFLESVVKRLGLGIETVSQKTEDSPLWAEWKELARKRSSGLNVVKIALVGKYTNLKDAYMSVSKAFEHAGLSCNRDVHITWVEASELELETSSTNPVAYHKAWQGVCSCDGVMIPGGFGDRGIEGMILAAKWAREHRVPFLGVCLGLQVAVIEFARNVCGLDGANSMEFDPETEHPVVVFMPEIDKNNLGGTMRLGRRASRFCDDSFSASSNIAHLYGNQKVIHERHRHRYEVNPSSVAQLEDNGLHFVARDLEAGDRMEVLQLEDHPYYVATQFHPEYLTHPLRPSRPFLGLVLAASGQLESFLDSGAMDDLEIIHSDGS